MLRSHTTVLRRLMVDLSAGRMPPPEAIEEGRAALEESDRARAEYEAAKSWTPPMEETHKHILEGRAHVTLTKPQWENLRDMVAYGPQPTFGKGRARVQNWLVSMGFATFTEDKPLHTCVVTDVGRKVFEANTKDGRYVPDRP